eukprot:7019624-Pyramimonas_sp.AAC.1
MILHCTCADNRLHSVLSKRFHEDQHCATDSKSTPKTARNCENSVSEKTSGAKREHEELAHTRLSG